MLDKYLRGQGFTQGGVGSNLYFMTKGDNILVVVVYVDDNIFGRNHDDMCCAFPNIMKAEFEMSILGELSFLGYRSLNLRRVSLILR